MGLKDEFDEIVGGAKDAVNPTGDGDEAAVPGVATPDQTRPDGFIPDPGLSRADTSGLVEDRKRKGNLTGM